ncbi:PTS beta-glucoside transporter subunit EIIBCA [Enterococcus sp. HMSC29A04]|uniref:PTS beta-glucoside transporter subunit IIBCA n=1 Tax=Enterococcus TaxID=1350 RepID=UPI0007F39C4E|nr:MULTISPECIES: PTS transporter subunit IIBCA [Enterococcus]SAZ39485.1 PTS system, trehalose/maltose-specific, IIBCA component [Enterococcus faecium]MDT2570184.1 glucose PTS transporter subunit IIA [Enterococcus raffinosus]OFT87702.1 PTS beta-glucoside transporter subunit EIIBCA [Enterococcus sp. HMSC29A04]OFU58961.1 PTS beta-glucoside transporter subunit EIIBCA [Enterococcus sp. HMSC14A10]QXJ61508.1 PTS glucose transporter subunit IIA [Enterococcus raffinosus]
MTKTNYQEIAKKLVAVVGEDNIVSATHCATRLRLQVKDRKAIDDSQVEQVEEVKGVFYNAGQYQIILGTGIVNKVYDALQSIYSFNEVSKDQMAKDDSSPLQRAVRNIADIFVPIIPILGATGLFLGLKGVLFNETVLNVMGLTPDSIPEWLSASVTVLTDTAFGFLTAFICWSAFKKMGGLPIIGFLIGLMLVSPALPNAYAVAGGTAEPIMAFGMIPLVGYQGSILTALITGMIGATLEKKLRKIMPNAMDLIFTPFLVILVSVFVALFVLGPIVHAFEVQAVKVIELFLHLPLGIGGLIIGFLYPIAVMTGMHHMFIMIETSLIASTGFNPLITVCAMYGFANAAVCLAIALRTKSASVKTAGISATITQMLGVSEPALFGVVMRTGMKAILVMLGSSAVGGMVLSLLGIQANSYGLAVLLSPLMYIYEPYQVITYVVVGIATFILAYVLTNLFVIKKSDTVEKVAKTQGSIQNVKVYSPIEGEIIPITEVNDQVFASKMMGEGFAVLPSNGTIKAPISGIVKMIAPTKHAIGIVTDDGMELLLHLGIDTVELNGAPFNLTIKEGEMIQQGQVIGTIDLKRIEAKGKDATVMVIITNSKETIAGLEYNQDYVQPILGS